jgi:hypothetical protein
MANPRWDTPFNRVINVIKGRAKSLPPTSASRVAGYGTYDKVGDFKKEDREAKKERNAAAAAVTTSERREVEKLREHMPDLITEQVQQKLREIIPDELWEGLAAWNAAGRRGPLVVPNISGSNSIQHMSPDVVTPNTANVEAQPAAAPVPPPAAANMNTHLEVALVTPPPADANTEQPIAPVPPPTIAKAQPMVLRRKASRRENDTGVSTLAELNAISKVMTSASTFHFLCL